MWPPTGLIPWFSKTEGNTYATLLHHPFLFKGKPTQCSRGSNLHLADSTIKKPMGRINDVLIGANRNYVLDIDCNPTCPIILGRPFLRKLYDEWEPTIKLRLKIMNAMLCVIWMLVFPRFQKPCVMC
mgnify:CR=1 FL=1